MLAMSAPSGPASGRSYQRLSLYFLTVAGVVFRSEIAVLVATQTLFLLATRQASLPDTIIPAGAAGLVMGLLLSVLVDSFFWQQYPLWPELSGFYYNTILGKSSDWGVSPWHFYFTSALPRLLLNPITYALIFIAVTSPATRGRTMAILVPCLTFVGIYSILPHKEWRFIIYVVPPLTAVASVGASWLWIRRTKSALYQLLSLLLVSSVIMSLFASTGLLAVSRLNYPGGEAVSRLREIAANDTGTIRVYADNLVCQTGLTRFLESRNERDLGRRSPRWAFDKTENQTALLDPLFWKHLDYVLAESPERVIGAWQTVDVVKGFAGVQVLRPSDDVDTREEQTDHSRLPFMARVEQLGRQYVTRGWWARVRMDPKVHILRKQSEAEILQGATSVETL
jgi:alpha-1,6-mannosyltransferase